MDFHLFWMIKIEIILIFSGPFTFIGVIKFDWSHVYYKINLPCKLVLQNQKIY